MTWLHKLRHYRESYGFSAKDLSVRSGISLTAIHRIESGSSPYKVNEGVAKALADALDVQVYDIFDKSELSHLGRPPHTGTPIGSFCVIEENETVCSGCQLVVPRAVGCDTCGIAA